MDRCAVAELKEYFETRRRKEQIKVYSIDDHFDVAQMISVARKIMGVRRSDMASISQGSIPRGLIQLLAARLHGARFIMRF